MVEALNLVTRSELARLAGVSKTAITKACRSGGRLAPACVGVQLRADHDAVVAYLAKHAPAGRAPESRSNGRKLMTEDSYDWFADTNIPNTKPALAPFAEALNCADVRVTSSHEAIADYPVAFELQVRGLMAFRRLSAQLQDAENKVNCIPMRWHKVRLAIGANPPGPTYQVRSHGRLVDLDPNEWLPAVVCVHEKPSSGSASRHLFNDLAASYLQR
jgi:hypothetical protein